jgi:hypothetical protein
MVRALGWIGVVGAAAAMVVVLTLDATVGGQPSRRGELRAATISEYVYTSGSWAFVAAVLMLAGGSAALLYGLVRAGRIQPGSAGSLLLALWVVGLVAVVAFPKHNFVAGPSVSGTVHRYATLIAFIALPLAVLVIARGRAGAARAARWLAVIGIGWLTVLFGAIVVGIVTGQRWWTLIPLGLVERGIAGFEVAALIALGVWLVRDEGAELAIASRTS